MSSEMPDYARDQHGNLAEQVARGRGAAPTERARPRKSRRLELAKASACTACHGVSEQASWVPDSARSATRYAGDAAAAGRARRPSSRRGGSGAWGAIPMPAQPQLKDADARTLVQWILSGSK